MKCECKLGDICEHHGTAMFHGKVCPTMTKPTVSDFPSLPLCKCECWYCQLMPQHNKTWCHGDNPPPQQGLLKQY